TPCMSASAAFCGIGANGAVDPFVVVRVSRRVCTAMASATSDGAPSTSCVGPAATRVGEPDAGNLHVRFDEGERLITAPYSTVEHRDLHDCRAPATRAT